MHILFTTRNLSLVKSYVQRQCGKLLNGQGNLQEYMFAKEYRGREYYRPGACVPALELARYVQMCPIAVAYCIAMVSVASLK